MTSNDVNIIHEDKILWREELKGVTTIFFVCRTLYIIIIIIIANVVMGFVRCNGFVGLVWAVFVLMWVYDIIHND